MSATPSFVMAISDDPAVRGQVLVNGLDIADSVVGVRISSTAKSHEVVLALALAPIRRPFDVELGMAFVTVDEVTHQLLVDLGWTPPPEPPGSSVPPTPEDPGPTTDGCPR